MTEQTELKTTPIKWSRELSALENMYPTEYAQFDLDGLEEFLVSKVTFIETLQSQLAAAKEREREALVWCNSMINLSFWDDKFEIDFGFDIHKEVKKRLVTFTPAQHDKEEMKDE